MFAYDESFITNEIQEMMDASNCDFSTCLKAFQEIHCIEFSKEEKAHIFNCWLHELAY